MKNLSKIISFIIVFSIIVSCSTQKDAFVNRKFHSLTTKYNVLFNGEQAFEKGLKKIEDEHEDNFWKRLQIEPITFKETEAAIAPKFNGLGSGFDETPQQEEQQKPSTPFDIAEEKAVKAIQKHSMNIKGYEKNGQIDDAYLLLGKSRYYTQRYIPAIEAYNYIIANYPDADLNYETRVWRAKANTRLGNEKIAIEAMKLLMKVVDEKETVPERIQEQAHTAMAMAYAETDTIQKVIEHLTKATQTFYNKDQSARNMFVLGQIYSELGRKDSARTVFRELADNRKAPDKYRIHANIELVKNSVKDSTDVILIDRFKKLIRDTDNRKYYDELYYQIGTLYESRGNIDKAIGYYKKSLKAKKGTDYQKTHTYEALGNIFFKKQNYLVSGAYYDSVMKIVPKEFENEKRIRRIKRKNKGLIKLKKYEDIVKNNDSILNIVAMSDTDRTSYFNKHIEKIKKEDKERRQQLANSQNFGNAFGSGMSFNTSKNRGKWYFYNTQSKQFGKAEFERIWGNRPLEDNWRLSDKTTLNSTKNNKDGKELKNESRYKLATYLDAIPNDPKQIKKLKEERNDALYQLGLSYKEQFKNAEASIKNLERLKGINTNKDLELPINYHLYQIYTSINNVTKANEAKSFIMNNYPFSTFADIINSPNKKVVSKEKEDAVTKKYEEIYYIYRKGNYPKVVEQINSFSETVEKSELIPKFALLKALSIGKYKSKEEYQKALDFVAFSYANTSEGKKAQEIINLLKK